MLMTKTPRESKAKKKRVSIAGLLDKAAVLLQKIRRIESSNSEGYCVCVTCNHYGHYKEMQGGHFIPRVKTATKITPENIHPQCVSCNKYRAEEAKIHYYKFMVKKYGQSFVDELVEESKKTVKYGRIYLLEKIAEFKERLKVLDNH